MKKTIYVIAEIKPGKFELLSMNYPIYAGVDKNKFKAITKLDDGHDINMTFQPKVSKNFAFKLSNLYTCHRKIGM